ncbi:M12 family metallopeptidase [Deinococcus aquaedulcis]|uniref:M12 family metallopeptidase n=1 Tax=Deinococcus aquaedulcis TaxID=2840455 RepID=UPI001C83EAB7|nr:M12 family metallopeptidase [Deinococcus aquaedulcis]
MKHTFALLPLTTLALLAGCAGQTPLPESAALNLQGGPTFRVDLRETPLAALDAAARARLSQEAAVEITLRSGTTLMYRNVGGHIVVDGDMLLGRSEDAAQVLARLDKAPAGSLGTQSLSRFAAGGGNWANKTVPYFWKQGALTATQVAAVNAAVERWNAQAGTTLRWVWNPNAANKVEFVVGGGGCGSSYVGAIGGTQPLTIAPNCFNNSTIIHEMGHASGFHHEHQRCDRDNYITVGSAYVGDTTNFGKTCNAYTHGPYDYDSVMNYFPPYIYARSQPVGTYNGSPSNLGKVSELSRGDLFALQAIYPGGTTPPPTTGRTYTGTLNSGAATVQPGSSGFSYAGGTLKGSLTGPAGSDFDLYLQRWSGSAWGTVAQSTSPGNTETVSYAAGAGTYRWYIYSYSGSGTYSLTETK